MFKKSLIVASILALSVSTAVYAADVTATKAQVPPCKCEKTFDPAKKAEFEQKRAEFDQRLNLTDEQKAQAQAIREKGRKEMQPVMDKLKAKSEEAQAVRNSKLAPDAQQKKLDKIYAEKKALKGQLADIRKKNMQEFEAILTPDQQAELAKMKEEGKQKFQEGKGKHGQCGCKKPCNKTPDNE